MSNEEASFLARSFFVVGPTASGKTALALALAEACHGEIIGADAFQIYKGLPLLTTKPTPEELRRVPHHLIGAIPLSQESSVATYREMALKAIAAVLARGKTPIITGGTGFYIKALTHGLSDVPPGAPALRETLSLRSLEDLLGELERLDPLAASQIDRKNPRRVVRALEVTLLSGRPFSSFKQESPPPEIHGVFLDWERETLYRRIEERTRQLFAQGVVQEVAETQSTLSATASQVLGLKEITALLRGEIDEPTCIAQIAQATRHYAKRQLTWFRRESIFTLVSMRESLDIFDSLLPLVLRRIPAPPPPPF